MVASFFSPLPCYQQSGSGSTTGARNSRSNHLDSVATMKLDLESEPEIDPVPENSSVECKPVGNSLSSPNVTKKVANLPRTDEQGAKNPVGEGKHVKQPGKSYPLMAEGSRRRKDLMSPPTKLSERIAPARSSDFGKSVQTTPFQADLDEYKDWYGGSLYEVDEKPWNILGWLTEGLKKKLQRK